MRKPSFNAALKQASPQKVRKIKMNLKDILKILIIITIFTLSLGFAIGEIITFCENKNNTYDIHQQLENNNFKYCPYCGEELKIDLDNIIYL